MARIISIQEEIELSLRLLEKEYDPFQMDLEWFKYELSIKAKRAGQTRPAEAPSGTGMPALMERHAARGKINRKDFSALLSGVDGLILRGQDLRYEPYDLNFYLEWKLETPRVYSIVTWFDMALSPRNLNSRFPSTHLGFRFLTDQDSLGAFRSNLEMEFISTSPTGRGDAPPRIN